MTSSINHLDRKIKLCHTLPIKEGVGIEFGPLSRPIIRASEGDIRYVDALNNEELELAFKGQPYYSVDEFVKISYAWKRGSLVALTGHQKFDYALASHVIEHVPDVLGWLNHITDVLGDDGQIALAIPDKRYTFDATRDDTTVAQFIDMWLRNASVPQPMQIYDHFSHAIKFDIDHFKGVWDGTIDVSKNERHHTDREALQLALDRSADGEYIDCHASVFTPKSFLTAVSSFIRLGLLDVKVKEFFDTLYYANEFIVILQKQKYDDEGRSAAVDRTLSYLAGLNQEKLRSPNATIFVDDKAKLDRAVEDIRIAQHERDAAMNEVLILRESLDKAQNENHLAAEKIRIAERARQDLERERDAVLNSRTWRIFEPYRSAMRTIRNRRR